MNTRCGIMILVILLCTLLSCIKDDAPHAFIDDLSQMNRPTKRDRVDLAMEQEYAMTMDPELKRVPKQRLLKAKKLFHALSAIDEKSNKKWVERGPDNMGGRTRAAIFDLQDETGQTILAGSVSGGLWKCENILDSLHNLKWENLTHKLNSAAISSIAQNPNVPSQIAAGTGEAYFGNTGIRGNGIYLTTDGGQIWTHVKNTSHIDYITKIEFDQQGRIYLGTLNYGLLRSSDFGESWETLLKGNLHSISNQIADFEFIEHNEIIVGVGINEQDGVYKSKDDGKTWRKITSGLATGEYERIEISKAPSDPSTLYLVLTKQSTKEALGVYKSTDKGENWKVKRLPRAYGLNNFTRNQAWYNLCIGVDPLDPSDLWLGGIDLHKSTSSGTYYRQIGQWQGKNGIPLMHADQHLLLFDRRFPNRLLVGNDGGVYLSTNAGVNKPTFKSLNHGYNVTQLYSVAYASEAGSNDFLVGAQDNGTLNFDSEGINSSIDIGGGDGTLCFIDQDDPSIQIITNTYNNYQVSYDGGEHFQKRFFGNTGRFINPMTYDDNQNILYAAHSSGQFLRWKDIDQGNYFYELPYIFGIDQKFSALTLARNEEQTFLYLGTDHGDIYKVENPANGNFLDAQKIRKGKGEYISSISYNSDLDVLLFTCSNYGVSSVYLSSDEGSTWIDVEGDLPDMPVRSSLFEEINSNQVYLATEVGVWYTHDVLSNPVSWKPFANSPEIRTDMIKQRSSDGVIFAATHGRGLFTFQEHKDIVANLNYSVEKTSFDMSESSAQDIEDCNLNFQILIIDITVKELSNEQSNEIQIEVLNNSTATQNQDYSIGQSHVDLEKNNQIFIKIFDDRIVEQNESIYLKISSEGQVDTIDITIMDDDKSVKFSEESVIARTALGKVTTQSDYAPFRGYYEDERAQVLVTKEELINAGFEPGIIEGLSLNVSKKESSEDHKFIDFSVAMGHTAITHFETKQPFIDEIKTVYRSDLSTVPGENLLEFDEPFEWDGKHNLLIQFCFNNDIWDNDDFVDMVETDFKSMIVRYGDNAIGCAYTTSKRCFNYRPAIKLLNGLQSSTTNSTEIASDVCSDHSRLGADDVAIMYNSSAELIGKVQNLENQSLQCISLGISSYDSDWTIYDKGLRSQKVFELKNDSAGSLEQKIYFKKSDLYDLDIESMTVAHSYDNPIFDASNYSILKSSSVKMNMVTKDLMELTIRDNRSGFYFLKYDLDGITTSDDESKRFIKNKAVSIHLYPNPAKDEITYQMEHSADIRSLNVYATDGREVNLSIDNQLSDIGRIPIDDLRPGFYILKITDNNGHVTAAQFCKI